ncbi:MAG: hypothetical protein F6K30_30670 [Cyanothece sp. SIO2G6]|nr:hypothetical protein [Cyanothece sp. SIO2G6]
MVLLSSEAVIPEAKLTQYLLIPLPKADKSKFLAQAGYTLDNWQKLEEDLRTQVLSQLAELIETNRYGQKYCIRATITGENRVELPIKTIWMVTATTTRFVTLVPDKGANT